MAEQINIQPDVVLDLGEKACGDLVISLMRKVKAVEGAGVGGARAGHWSFTALATSGMGIHTLLHTTSNGEISISIRNIRLTIQLS